MIKKNKSEQHLIQNADLTSIFYSINNKNKDISEKKNVELNKKIIIDFLFFF